jgi:outer membrane protein TolC
MDLFMSAARRTDVVHRYKEVLPQGDSSLIVQPLSQFQASLVLKQLLYTGGRTFAALRTAQTLREMSTRDVSSTKQEIMLNVAGAFYGVLKAEKMVEKSRDSVVRMEHHKQITERETATRRTKANISNLLRARTLVSQADHAHPGREYSADRAAAAEPLDEAV